jgi:dipeptidyl aminopeptidase/acylaminoacyl peptidase
MMKSLPLVLMLVASCATRPPSSAEGPSRAEAPPGRHDPRALVQVAEGAVNGAFLQRIPVDLSDLELRSALGGGADELTAGVRLERIVYASDGLAVDGFLLLPGSKAGKASEPAPCVIYNRGGNRDFGGLKAPQALWLGSPLARAGYVVAMSDYRGNGPGLERYPPERTCEECGGAIGGVGREEFGGADVNDVLALIPLLESLPEADAARLGMYGWSRGGMMTYLALLRLAEQPGGAGRVRAAVVGAGVADSRTWLEERPQMEDVYAELVPDWGPETKDAAIEARSAVRQAASMPAETPLLLLHGGADWRVGWRQALGMTGALLDARRPVRLMLFEGGDHGLSDYTDEVDQAVLRWLDRYVRDGERWPGLELRGR